MANPNHDNRGRFSSGSGRAVSKTATMLRGEKPADKSPKAKSIGKLTQSGIDSRMKKFQQAYADGRISKKELDGLVEGLAKSMKKSGM